MYIILKITIGYYIYNICGGSRTEEGIVELLVWLLRHYKPEEGIYPRIGGEETKDFWELQLGRTGCGERIMGVEEVSSEK